MAKKKNQQMRNKKQVTRSQKLPGSPRAYDVGYGRPPKHTRYQKGQTGNPTGINRKSTAVTSADLQELLDYELNKKVRQGDRTRLMTRAAAGIEHLVAQFAAGDRHARRDVFALAKEAGIDLMRGQNKQWWWPPWPLRTNKSSLIFCASMGSSRYSRPSTLMCSHQQSRT
jgi:hypothetical protein